MLNDWYSLGQAQYRKWLVYDLKWEYYTEDSSRPHFYDISLENFLVCGAPFGGPIAMTPDSKRIGNINDEFKSKVLIFTSAGIKLAEIDWPEKNIIGLGWSDQENLIVVAENGASKLYDLHGSFLSDFSLLDSNSAGQILECHFWGNGVAAMISDFTIKVAEGLSSNDSFPRIYTLNTGLGIDRTYTSMTLIPPLLSRSGLLEVLVGTSDHSVLVIHESGNETEIEDQLIHHKVGAPITKISLGPDGRYLACYRKDGVLTVMTSSFTTKVLDFDTRSASRPISIQWCGKDSVILQWRNTGLVMVGPYGDWLNFPYESSGIHIVAELDCCRIITSNSCEILQIVPSATVGALEIGSTEPAALILDAMEAFEEGDPKSDENIRTIASANQLQEAVQACIASASAEFFPQQQQRLLKAASYGKAFCPELDPSEFVETAKKLRVLNEVRRSHIGLPLTIQQYNRLTPEVLVGRLTTRNQHFLALKICEFLKLKNDRILIHWACEKVRRLASQNLSDEEINRVIKSQLAPYGRVSYLAVAEAAYSKGRRRLATIILDNEQQPDDQIPLLLKMNEEELALQKAINSEDTDLIYYTLISLESRIPFGSTNRESFFKIIQNYPEAANLLKIYYRNKVTSQDRTSIQNLLLSNKSFLEAGNIIVLQALQQSLLINKIQLLKEASQMYSNSPANSTSISSTSFVGNSLNKDLFFYKSIIDENIELMELQKNFEIRAQTKYDFTTDQETLHETLEGLINLSIQDPNDSRWIEQEIQKIMKKFKVNEKMVYYLKINCYSKAKDWISLNKFANEKKSPVGYRPFATACIKYGGTIPDIEKFIEKITILEDKYELLMEIKSYSKSADVAFKLRDPDRLQEVGRLCQDPNLERYIQDSLNKF